MKAKAIQVLCGAAAFIFCITTSAADFTEGFESIPGLTAKGWVQANTGGAPTNPWFQGNGGAGGVFDAQAGTPNSYAAADFLSSGSGAINNWLISPSLLLSVDSTLSFYTRSAGTPGFADLLDVAFLPGNGPLDLASFVALGTIGAASLYPTQWTLFTFALPDVASGRFAFHQRGTVDTADYLGVDSVNVTSATPVPEPSSLAIVSLGLAGLALYRRRRNG